MLFSSLLIPSVLLASVVLADLRLETREPFILNSTEDATPGFQSTNAAGALWGAGANTFDYVTGTFIVPRVTGKHGSGAAAWVGIDGYTCNSVLFTAGVDISVDSHGKTSYQARYQWYPDDIHTFDLAISPGDEIRVWIHAYFPTSGLAKIHNLTTNKYVVQYVTSSHALCGRDAGWFVETLATREKQEPLADFGTVTFTDTKAAGPSGSRTASGATPVNLVLNSVLLVAAAKVDGSSVVVSYQ